MLQWIVIQDFDYTRKQRSHVDTFSHLLSFEDLERGEFCLGRCDHAHLIIICLSFFCTRFTTFHKCQVGLFYPLNFQLFRFCSENPTHVCLCNPKEKVVYFSPQIYPFNFWGIIIRGKVSDNWNMLYLNNNNPSPACLSTQSDQHLILCFMSNSAYNPVRFKDMSPFFFFPLFSFSAVLKHIDLNYQ